MCTEVQIKHLLLKPYQASPSQHGGYHSHRTWSLNKNTLISSPWRALIFSMVHIHQVRRMYMTYTDLAHGVALLSTPGMLLSSPWCCSIIYPWYALIQPMVLLYYLPLVCSYPAHGVALLSTPGMLLSSPWCCSIIYPWYALIQPMVLLYYLPLVCSYPAHGVALVSTPGMLLSSPWCCSIIYPWYALIQPMVLLYYLPLVCSYLAPWCCSIIYPWYALIQPMVLL